jgi:hypothetical protein
MPGLAARLSRALVACYPRRWRQCYAGELLEVLDQHRPSARTVLNLAASAASTHLDPAYRAGRPDMTRLRTAALVFGAFVVLLGVPFGYLVHQENWKDSHWPIGIEGSMNAMAFGPGQRILLTGTSGPSDGTDALWNVARLRKPARIAQLRTGDHNLLWGEAFSPDGRILATAFTDRIYLWDLASPARPRLVRVLAAPVTPPSPAACGPVRAATMPTLPAARLAVDFCGAGGCPAGAFTLGFAPDGRTLTAVVNFAAAGPAGPQAPPQSVRDYVFTWNLTRPRSVTRVAAFSHPAPVPVGGGDGGQPLLAPGWRTVVDGAAFGSFGITLWQLP